MKVIRYNLYNLVNHGCSKNPDWQEVVTAVEMNWSEANEAIAKQEAHNGEYTVTDDGRVSPPSQEARVSGMEEAL